MLDYLEASLYRNADRNTQLKLRQNGLIPSKPDAEMPEPYRIWKTCQRHDTLWWSGGISNQPHIMMLEFAVCEIADDAFDNQLRNIKNILREN